jgi:thiamine-phosphate pyrophosphorylase
MASSSRARRLAAARLYLVTGIDPGGRPTADVVRGALRGGADVVQLRDKTADDAALLAAAAALGPLCAEHGALFVVNDRPDLAAEVGADGVHVGQDDLDPAAARAVVGDDAIVGLSTHAPHEVDRAAEQGVDYIGVGPVHATPTKPGRPAVGLALVEHAAAHARLPWFAIGGIDPGTIDAVVAAGAERIVVVRAIAEAADPEAAARGLRDRLGVTV